MLALYLHIPFCARICHYCDFAVLRAPARMHGEFLDLLLRELDLRAPMGLASVRTAYLGGGTPSVLSPASLERLLGALQQRGLQNLQEFTMEFNPEQVHADAAAVARSGGVDRFSMGLQSLDDSMLRFLGRPHDRLRALEAWDLLSSSGFRTGSVDLMFHLPGQTLDAFLDDVCRVAERKPGHVSFYGLNVERSTLLGQRIFRGEFRLNEDLYAPMYNGAMEILHNAGLERYEVSNCALPGHESLHNQMYWQRRDYLGVGPGAHSCLAGVRLAGPRHYARWKEWVQNGCPAEAMESERLDRSARLMEAIWLSLRCREGLDLAALSDEFGFEMPARVWDKLLRTGWVQVNGERLVLYGDGWLFMDSVAVTLQGELERLVARRS